MRWGRVVLAVVGVPAVLAVGGIGWLLASLPANQGPRLETGVGPVGIETGGSYAWIVPTANGVLLVDAGNDPAAVAVIEELARRGAGPEDVHTVLLTHAHPDHIAGVARFPRARVLVGRDDLPLAVGEAPMGTPIGTLFSWFVELPVLDPAPEPVDDGFEADFDGVHARAVAVPGHSAGSVAWVVDGVLFSGDALIGTPDGVSPSPWIVDQDAALAEASVSRLAGLGVDVMADGHVGVTREADARIAAFLEARNVR